MTPPEVSRLERKVDSLTDAVNKLVLFEERQTVQALAITGLTARVTTFEHKLEMWINRGMGAWALAFTAFSLYKTIGNS